jgi:hypothetical protein
VTALLLATAAALTASATVGEPDREPASDAPPNRGAIEAEALRLTPRVARRVERIRGLQFEQVPEPRVITAERFAEIAAAEAATESRLEEQLEADESTARLLGLMEADEDLDVLAGGAPDLAAAAWDTRRERLYVIADAAQDRALLEFLLAHELDHALEDQAFGLPEGEGVGDDEALATIALIEGSATTVMVEYGARHLNPLALGVASAGLDPGTGGVPRFYVQALTWAYLGGAEFVAALRAGGPGWSRVDAALANPPASTEQVLHPDAFLESEPPLEARPDASAPVARGWRLVDRGELGEFTTSQLLEVGAPKSVARAAAAGWGGDGYALLAAAGAASDDCAGRCRGERLLVVEWRWDSAAEAREFVRTLPAYLVGGLGAKPRAPSTWSLGAGWAAAWDSQTTTRLALAPSRSLAELAASGAGPGPG